MPDPLTQAPPAPATGKTPSAPNPKSMTPEQLDKAFQAPEGQQNPTTPEEPVGGDAPILEEGQEPTGDESQQAPPAGTGAEVDKFYLRSEDGTYKEAAWQDLEIPLKYKGKIIDVPYDEVRKLAQLGYDSTQRYQEFQAATKRAEHLEAIFPQEVEKQATQRAREIFEAWAQQIESEPGSEAGDNKSKADRVKQLLLEQKIEQLESELSRDREERGQSSKQAQLAENSRTMTGITERIFSEQVKKLGSDREAHDTFKTLVTADITREVKRLYNETGSPISFQEFERVAREASNKRLRFFLGRQPAAPIKKGPTTPPLSGGNGSPLIPTTPQLKNKLRTREGLKSLSLDEIERLGR